MENLQTWIGLGLKGGGTLAFVGMESVVGFANNLSYLKHSQQITISSLRAGAGLGGGAGITAILVYNCIDLQWLNGTRTTDWGFNLAVGGKWDGVVKALGTSKFFMTLAKWGVKLHKATPEAVENIRTGASLVWSAYDIQKMNGPKLVTIDIPFAGIGVEASLHYLDGEISIGKLRHLQTD